MFIEAKSPVNVAADSNAHGFTDRLRRPGLSAKPKRPGGAQVNAVIALVDAHRGSKSARPSRQVAQPRGFAIYVLREMDSFDQFERAQKNAGTHAWKFARDVQ